MTTQPDGSNSNASDERTAAKRYYLMNGARIGGLAAVLVGLAMTRSVIPGPFALGAVLAVVGMVAFFFAPPLLAKRWKAGDQSEETGGQ